MQANESSGFFWVLYDQASLSTPEAFKSMEEAIVGATKARLTEGLKPVTIYEWSAHDETITPYKRDENSGDWFPNHAQKVVLRFCRKSKPSASQD